MSFSAAERQSLARLFRELGPDAPTLCEGWTTHDLVVHLWIRENRLNAAAGMFIGFLEDRLRAVTNEVKKLPFGEVVDLWEAGPVRGRWWGLVDARINVTEHFVHHEDVRRANGKTEPRELSRAAQQELHGALKLLAPRFLKSSNCPVILLPQGFDRLVCADSRGVARRGNRVVTVSGPVGELLLWVFGRESVELDFEGDVTQVRMK